MTITCTLHATKQEHMQLKSKERDTLYIQKELTVPIRVSLSSSVGRFIDVISFFASILLNTA